MRTGLGAFFKLAHGMCRLLGVWRPSIVAAINASPAPQADKDKLLGLLNAVDTACAAVDLLRPRWES